MPPAKLFVICKFAMVYNGDCAGLKSLDTTGKYIGPVTLPVTEIVLQNGHCRFIQQEEAVLIGSGLIIPKAHRETVFALTQTR